MTSRLTLFAFLSLLVTSILLRSPLLFFLAVLLGLVAGASALWGRYCLAGISYVRRFGSARLFCGETTDLWLETTNLKPLPLPWLKIEDEFPAEVSLERVNLSHAGRTGRSLLATFLSLGWYERVRRHYQLHALRRGVFEFGPVILSSGDLFGFRVRSQTLAQHQPLMVYPRVVPLHGFGLLAARPLGDFKAARRILEDPLRLAGAREYHPGDSLRHVHWKTTARRGALHSKVFEPSATPQIIVCLNSQTFERAHQGVQGDSFELAAVISASLAAAALEAGHPVGLLTNGGVRGSQTRLRLAASRSPQQLTRVLEALAQLTYFTLLPFERLLRLEAARLPFGATLLAVSAIVSEPILSSLLDLRAAGHPVALIAVEAAPFVAPPELPMYRASGDWRSIAALSLNAAEQPVPVNP